MSKYSNVVTGKAYSMAKSAKYDYDDLCQEGYCAMWKAFEGWDVTQTRDFFPHMVQYIDRAMKHYQNVHFNSFSGSRSAYNKYKKILNEKGTVTYEDLKAINMKDSTIEGLLRVIEGGFLFSLDDEDAQEYLSAMPGKSPLSSIDFFDWRKYLTKEEIVVAELYFGFGGPTYPLYEIEQYLGITTTALTEIIKSIVSKLRVCEDIKDYGFYSENVEPDNDYVVRPVCVDKSRTEWASNYERNEFRNITKDLMRQKGIRMARISKALSINDGSLSRWFNVAKYAECYNITYVDAIRIYEFLLSCPTKEILLGKVNDLAQNRDDWKDDNEMFQFMADTRNLMEAKNLSYNNISKALCVHHSCVINRLNKKCSYADAMVILNYVKYGMVGKLNSWKKCRLKSA